MESLYQICITSQDGQVKQFNNVLYFHIKEEIQSIILYVKVDFQMKMIVLDNIDKMTNFKVEEEKLSEAPSF